ncbi:MAG: Diaminopimelate decarboxylase [Planctomycetes bacterium]|nr:Diaminopimelate decarboxylase [Planctomycetota bacterium]
MQARFFPDAPLARDVAARFGTPCYVYDAAHLDRAADAVLSFAAPFGLTARFAAKANPNRAVLRRFAAKGLHFDASTTFEAERVIRAGVEPSRVQVTAQMLGEGIERLVAAGVRVTACSLAQLERIAALRPACGVGLRINPGAGSGANNRTQVAGRDASFGLWHEQVSDAAAIARRHGIAIRWAHHHVGSGGDPAKWAAIAATTLSFLDRLPDVDTVNLGGGFKVARIDGEKETDLAAAAAEAAGLLRAFAERTGRRLRLEVEPGTWLVANAGAIVARVVDVVSTGRDGHVFVKIDAGMAEILRPSLYGAQHPIGFAAADGARPLGAPQPLLVVGPCCESGDLLTPAPGDPEGLGHRTLPLPAPGDLCVIGGAGAYCAAMAARNYNSIPAAPEVMQAADGSLALVRRRQTFEDVFRDESC